MAQRPYFKDRLIENMPEGYLVIVPIDAEPPVPLACEICNHVFRNRDDEASYHEFGCCERCSRLWAQSRRQAWQGGWRPTIEQVKAAESDRMPLALNFHVD